MVNERLRTAVRPRWGDVSTPLRRFPPRPGMAATTVHSTSTRRSGAMQLCDSATARHSLRRVGRTRRPALPTCRSAAPRLRRSLGPRQGSSVPRHPPALRSLRSLRLGRSRAGRRSTERRVGATTRRTQGASSECKLEDRRTAKRTSAGNPRATGWARARHSSPRRTRRS
jgi:hypothetical protein